jgi:Fungal potassium channel
MLRFLHSTLLKVSNSSCIRNRHSQAQAWTRIVFAEGPRQVINALTLYSVLQADLIPEGKNSPRDGHSPIAQFFDNIGILADKNHQQAVVLLGMLWTLVIWVISALGLAASLILYLLFLFHHIPSEDGDLSTYCRRKINRRMERIIKAKVDKALKKEDQLRARQQAKDGRDIKRQPTLPFFDDAGELAMPGLSRQPTQTTLPEYASYEGSVRHSAESLNQQPTLPDVGLATSRPPPPTRTATHASSASWASHGSKAPLIGDAACMGYSNSPVVETPGQATSAEWPARPPPSRSMTSMSQSTQRSHTPGFGTRSASAQGDRPTPGTYPMEPLSRPGTGMSSGTGSTGRRGPGPSPTDSQGRRTPAAQYNPYFPPVSESGRQSPARTPSNRSRTPVGTMPQSRSFTPGGSRSMTPGSRSIGDGPPRLPRFETEQNSNNGGYQAYSPNNYSGTPYSAAPPAPYRSFTQPNMSSGMPIYSGRQTPQSSQSAYPTQRSGTAPLPQRQNDHDDMMDDIVSGYR